MGPLIPRTQLALWLDVTLLVSICLLESVTFTGLSIHEWLALLIVGFVLLHLLLSWTWIAASSRRLMATGASRTRVNFLVNACLFASAVTVILSGLMISEVALPAFGIKSAVDGKWKHLHNRTSTYLVDTDKPAPRDKLGMVPGGGQEVLIRSTLVRAIIRWAGRVAILSLAGAIVATTVYFSVALDPIHPADSLSRNAMVVEPFRHRSLDPQPANLMEFVRHFIAVGVVALVGRKILRLRL